MSNSDPSNPTSRSHAQECNLRLFAAAKDLNTAYEALRSEINKQVWERDRADVAESMGCTVRTVQRWLISPPGHIKTKRLIEAIKQAIDAEEIAQHIVNVHADPGSPEAPPSPEITEALNTVEELRSQGDHEAADALLSQARESLGYFDEPPPSIDL